MGIKQIFSPGENRGLLALLAGAVLVTILLLSLNTLLASRSQRLQSAEKNQEPTGSQLPTSYPTTRQQTQPAVKTPTPLPTQVDPTADWKTYRNEEYGYSIKYPPTTEIKELGGDAVNQSHIELREVGISILINQLDWETLKNDTLHLMSSQNYKTNKTKINGLEALHISGEAVRVGDAPGKANVYVDQYLMRVESTNYILILKTNVDLETSQVQEQKAIFEQMLNTLTISQDSQ